MTIQQIIEKQLGDQMYFIDQDVLNQLFTLPIMSCNVEELRRDYRIDTKQLRMQKEAAIGYAKDNLPKRFIEEMDIKKYVHVSETENEGVVDLSCKLMLLR